MEIKDLPNGVRLDWKDPPVPEDRHLSADIMPFSEYSAMRKRIGGRNAFAPQTVFSSRDQEELEKNPVMAAIKDDYVFTRLSMEPDSILFLEQVIDMFKPQRILELGTGLSTLILADRQKRQYKGKDVSYITIDQSAAHSEDTMKLAEQAGIRDAINPHVFNLCLYRIGDDLSIEEKALPCFDFDEERLHAALGGIRPDMIIIDGPADERTQYGVSMAKTLTLPVLRQYAAPGAVFFMDGAYMDTDLFAIEQWQESGAANVLGIKAVGRGMMVAVK